MTNKEKIINKVLEYKGIIQHVKDNQRTENNELYRYTTGLIQGLEFLTDMLIELDNINDVEKDKMIDNIRINQEWINQYVDYLYHWGF